MILSRPQNSRTLGPLGFRGVEVQRLGVWGFSEFKVLEPKVGFRV